MRTACWLVIPFLFVACKGSSDTTTADATGVWLASATPSTSKNDCEREADAFLVTVVQDASDSFFVQGPGFSTDGTLDGDSATFSFVQGSCTVEFKGTISAARLAGTLTYTCGSPPDAGCQTDMAVTGTRDLAAQAYCDKIRECGSIESPSSYIDCIGYFSENDVWGMDPNPSSTVSCIQKLACDDRMSWDIDACLDVDWDATTCKDATTLTVYNGSGSHRDVDCNVICEAYDHSAGSCSGDGCFCESWAY